MNLKRTIMKKSLQNRLKNYSLLSAITIIGSSESQAQIIHRDINYTGGHDSYDVDIDGDAFGDFKFNLKTESFNYYSSTDIYVKGVNVTGVNNNAVLGRSFVINLAQPVYSGNYVLGTSYSYYRFINSAFLGGTYKLTYNSSSYTSTSSGTFGIAYNLYEYKFIGFEFEISGENHYGWMRIKFSSANGSSWFLKDVAYNSVPDGQIKAGEMPLVSVDKNDNSSFKISSENNALNIITGNEMLGAKLEVYGMSGKMVLSQQINSNTEQIPYDLSKGIYVVRLLNNDKAITRKINL